MFSLTNNGLPYFILNFMPRISPAFFLLSAGRDFFLFQPNTFPVTDLHYSSSENISIKYALQIKNVNGHFSFA